MTNLKLNILCLNKQPLIDDIKQSDFNVLKNELENKKVEINIINNNNDLNFNTPIYIHSLLDCYVNNSAKTLFIKKYNDFYTNLDNNIKLVKQIKKIKSWQDIIPKINFKLEMTLDDILYTLLNIRKLRLPLIKLLDVGVIIFNKNYIQLIKLYMTSKNVSKACVRTANGQSPTFIVDLNKPDSFMFDISKYITTNISSQNLMVHPIKCEDTYMKGTISLIFISNKYSHAIIKKPINMETGERYCHIKSYSPDYKLLRLSKSIVAEINSAGKFPVIQMNFCFDSSGFYDYLLTKINYIDPKLYLKINKKPTKKLVKSIINNSKKYKNIQNMINVPK